MTSRDARTSAWTAVSLGKFTSTLLLVSTLAITLSGCNTLGHEVRPDYPSDQRGPQDQDPPGQPPAPPNASKNASSSYVVKGKRYHVKSDAKDHVENGTASWYGKRFHGRRTSSGERFDMHAMTAAHKNLPLSSLIQVTNLENGRSAVVRVNDRGPFHGNRVLDLSYAAASQLDMVDKGMAKVKIQVIDANKPALNEGLQRMFVAAADKLRVDKQPDKAPFVPSPGADEKITQSGPGRLTSEHAYAKVVPSAAIYLQVGSFQNRTHAETLRQKLVAKLEETVLVRTDTANDRSPYMVQVGPIDSKDEASDLSRRVASLGVDNLQIVTR